MRNLDWVNQADDVPEEVLRHAAKKDIEEEDLAISHKHGVYKWSMFKRFQHPVTTTIGVPLLCIIFLTIFFWPYIKEWLAPILEFFSGK